MLVDSASLVLVVHLLGTLHQRNHIAHAQYPVRHAVRVEHVNAVHFLARADELNRLVHHGLDGNGRPAARVAVEFGQYHAVEIDAFIECLGRVHRILAGHRIHDKKRFGRLDGFFDGFNLAHHFLVHRQTSGRVHNHQFLADGLGVADGILRNLHRILVVRLGIHLHAHLLAQNFQLVNGRRTVHIAGHQQYIAALLFEIHRQLARKRGLARTLQACHQDHRRVAFQVHVRLLAAHQFGQFVGHYFNQHLPRLHRNHDFLAHRLVLDRVGHGFGNLEVHVGIKQGLAHFFQRRGNVHIGNAPFAFQRPQGLVDILGEILEHEKEWLVVEWPNGCGKPFFDNAGLPEPYQAAKLRKKNGTAGLGFSKDTILHL